MLKNVWLWFKEEVLLFLLVVVTYVAIPAEIIRGHSDNPYGVVITWWVCYLWSKKIAAEAKERHEQVWGKEEER